MPPNSSEDYVRLGKHLEEIDGVFQQFLRESGYSDNTGALGRYPHRSAVLRGRVNRKIDLTMEVDSSGHRFEEYFPDIPYKLWACAWTDNDDSRYSNEGVTIFEHLPFSRAKLNLSESLAQAAQRLSVITEFSLRESGTRTRMRMSWGLKLLDDRNYYRIDAWRTLRRCSLVTILIPIGLFIIGALLNGICEICALLVMLPLSFYFAPAGFVFGQPHFSEYPYQPTDGIAFIYTFGLYLVLSVIFALIRLCMHLLADRAKGVEQRATNSTTRRLS